MKKAFGVSFSGDNLALILNDESDLLKHLCSYNNVDNATLPRDTQSKSHPQLFNV